MVAGVKMASDKTENDKELTSTVGNVLSTSKKDEKNDTSDATPTSSTDANTTATASQIVSDDPISSTSSDVAEQNKVKEASAAVANLSTPITKSTTTMNSYDAGKSPLDPEADLLEISMSNVPNEKITEDVEDLVQDLENLLGESTDSFNIVSKHTSPVVVKAKIAEEVGEISTAPQKNDTAGNEENAGEDHVQVTNVDQSTDLLKQDDCENVALKKAVDDKTDNDTVCTVNPTKDAIVDSTLHEQKSVADDVLPAMESDKLSIEENVCENNILVEDVPMEESLQLVENIPTNDVVQMKIEEDVSKLKEVKVQQIVDTKLDEPTIIVSPEQKEIQIPESLGDASNEIGVDKENDEIQKEKEIINESDVEVVDFTEVKEAISEIKSMDVDCKVEVQSDAAPHTTEVILAEVSTEEISEKESRSPVETDVPVDVVQEKMEVQTEDSLSIAGEAAVKVHEELPESLKVDEKLPTTLMEIKELPESTKVNDELSETKEIKESPETLKGNEELPHSSKATVELPQTLKVNEDLLETLKVNEDLPETLKLNEELSESVEVSDELRETLEVFEELPETPSCVVKDVVVGEDEPNEALVPGADLNSVVEAGTVPEVDKNEANQSSDIFTEVATTIDCKQHDKDNSPVDTPETCSNEANALAVDDGCGKQSLLVEKTLKEQPKEDEDNISKQNETVEDKKLEVIVESKKMDDDVEESNVFEEPTPVEESQQIPEQAMEVNEVVEIIPSEPKVGEELLAIVEKNETELECDATMETVDTLETAEVFTVESPTQVSVVEQLIENSLQQQQKVDELTEESVVVEESLENSSQQQKAESPLEEQTDGQPEQTDEQLFAKSSITNETHGAYDLIINDVNKETVEFHGVVENDDDNEKLTDCVELCRTNDPPLNEIMEEDSKDSQINLEIVNQMNDRFTAFPSLASLIEKDIEDNIRSEFADEPSSNDYNEARELDTLRQAVASIMDGQDEYIPEVLPERNVELFEEKCLEESSVSVLPPVSSTQLNCPSSVEECVVEQVALPSITTHHRSGKVMREKLSESTSDTTDDNSDGVDSKDYDTSSSRTRKSKIGVVETSLEEPLSIRIDESEKEKPYSPKITIKPIKVPDEDISTTSNVDAEPGKGSLKMTITKQSDTMHSILKIYNPDDVDSGVDYEQTIPKLIIKPKMQQVEQHSPKITRSSKQMFSSPTSSSQRSGSPRITIKPLVKPPDDKPEMVSPLKITIKPVLKPDDTSKKHSPKLTIKPITKPDDESPKEHKVQSPRVTIKPIVKPPEEADLVQNPRITIKPILKPTDFESETTAIITPKVTIRPLKRAEDIDSSFDDIDPPVVERFSPKVTIKPVLKPQEPDSHYHQHADGDEEVKKRIVLKINLPTPSKESKRRDHFVEDDKSEKLTKIKLKFSKEGHPHIVHQDDETSSHKRSHDEIPSTFEKSKKQKLDNVTSKHKDSTNSDGYDHHKSNLNQENDDAKPMEKLVLNVCSPIVISEDSTQDSGSVIIVEDAKDPLAEIPVFEITPESAKAMSTKTVVMTAQLATAASTTVAAAIPPMPRKRGRPRKVPLEVREDFKDIKEEQPPPKPEEQAVATVESGRPKRSCRGQNVRATLGIKPRKPRGPGRGRGSKRGGMGTRTEPMKPVKLSE